MDPDPDPNFWPIRTQIKSSIRIQNTARFIVEILYFILKICEYLCWYFLGKKSRNRQIWIWVFKARILLNQIQNTAKIQCFGSRSG